MSRIYLCDMGGISHWLWHAGNKDLKDEHGRPCGMLFGVREWFYQLLERYEPTHIAACFDGADNWRKKAYVEYKANRKPIDEALALQLNQLEAEVRSLGIHCVRHETFEADDTIATLCAEFASEETPVVIVSSDKDLAQLIGEHVTMFDPRPDKNGQTHLYDAKGATEKWGVAPHRMAEFLAIKGDASDNVPGVKGWGDVKARNAINQTRSWPELLRKVRAGQLEKITTAHQAEFVAKLADYTLSHELVSLRYDVPTTETLDNLAWLSPVKGAA